MQTRFLKLCYKAQVQGKRDVRGRIHDVLERRKDGKELPRDKFKVAVSQIVHEVDKSYISEE